MSLPRKYPMNGGWVLTLSHSPRFCADTETTPYHLLRQPKNPRDVAPMLDECCASVEDGGTAFIQHWVNVRFIQGIGSKARLLHCIAGVRTVNIQYCGESP